MTQINTEELKARTNIIDVIERHVPLTKKSSEFYGQCPFHDDHKDSLQVNEKKQIFKCFACDAGGDSIEFLTKLGIPFVDALSEINGGPINSGFTPEVNNAKKRIKPIEWTYISTPPQQTPTINHYEHGAPSKVWPYHNAEGLKVSYVCRFDLSDGSKQVVPYSFAKHNDRSEWRWMGIPNNRPLYNLHLIKQNPKAAIIIVEGEKTADAGQSQLNTEKTIFTCWIGGANGLNKTDFTPLTNRNVILFPDNDDAGINGMINVNEKIKSFANVHGFVKNSSDKPNKWDCADTEFKPNELRSYILKNMGDVPELPTPTAEIIPTTEAPKNPPLPPRPVAVYADNENFRYLGYLKDEKESLNYYFYSYLAQMVIRFSATGFSTSTLLQLAPLMYWEHNFPKSKAAGFDAKAAEALLIENSFKMKTFKTKIFEAVARGLMAVNL